MTLKCENERLEDVVGKISRQAGIGIVYDHTIWKNKARVTIAVHNMPVAELLDNLLNEQGLEYVLIGGMYCIKRKEVSELNRLIIKGKVTDEFGNPLEYTTVFVNNGPVITATVTDGSGGYTLILTLPVDSLVFSRVGYETRRIKYNGKPYQLINLKAKYEMLNAASVMGYEDQKLRKHEDTDEFYYNPKAGTSQSGNILEKIPGVFISPTGGLPRSSNMVHLRGPASIGVVPDRTPPNDPLIIIDGVPFAEHRSTLPIRSPLNDLGVLGRNVFENIDLNDIESIRILKDAEATAIWGARGANGVIMVSTKKAKPGQTGWQAKASAGIGRMTTLPEMLNARQYLEMRREAFRNDSLTQYAGVKPPDLFSWDTTKTTDFRKTLMSAYTKEIDLHTSVSGGFNLFQYFVSFGVFRNIISPDQVIFDRASIQGRLTYKSQNRKLLLDLANTYTSSTNKSGINELAGYLYLPPNIPRFDNDAYDTKTCTDLFKVQLKYDLTSSIRLSANLFHNKIVDDDHVVFPAGATYAINNSYQSRVIEPQLEYTHAIGQVKSTWLLGSTWQQISNKITSTAAESSRYNYVAFFSRAEFLLKNKYMMNLTAHRDQSGRLRADGRVGNFGALGVGWVFCNDSLFSKSGPFINYGKLKASYGITGNDQVDVNNDNKSWLFALNTRQYNSATLPIHVAGEDYTWQMNRKLDLGIELGFLKNRVSLYVDLYRSRAGNQVIAYPEPSMGINAVVVKNSSAVIENKGLELLLQLKNSRLGNLRWYANLALTFPNNMLVAFPGLATSLYANKLVVGKSVLVQQGYHFTGVDPESGLFQVADLDKDGRIMPGKDYQVFGDLNPKLLGRILFGFDYNCWELKFLFEGRRQNGYSLLYQVYANAVPGADMVNLPVYFLNRWRKPGDHSRVQRLSALNSAATRNTISNYVESDARLTDASYVRLKFVQLYYDLAIPGKLKLGIYLNADNLLTITKYKGVDPETQNIFTFPAQIMLTAGLRFSL